MSETVDDMGLPRKIEKDISLRAGCFALTCCCSCDLPLGSSCAVTFKDQVGKST